MSRDHLLRRVSDALGSRLLIWSGIRGVDAESLSDLEQFGASFTIIDRYNRRPLEHSASYELSSGRRVDMETWDIDDHLDAPASAEFRRGLLQTMAVPCALIPYRPSRFLSSLWFARQDRCLNLGLFGAHQSAFEHKPWVESSLRILGLPGLDWTYIADEEQLAAQDLLRRGAVVVRRSRTSGGAGIAKAATADELMYSWPRGEESFVSVSQYVQDGLPVNIAGTVWDVPGPDGENVTVHHASIQLIGIESCGTRPFGYYGNDFAAAGDLPDSMLDELERRTITIGQWLRKHGYRGTFGVDYLVKDGVPLFTEVNARFQGSSAASSRLSVEEGLPCLLLEHVAAFLGLPATARPPLREQVRGARPLAQVIVHWSGDEAATPDARMLAAALRAVDADCQAEALAPVGVTVEPGAIVGRLITRGRSTRTGFEIDPLWDAAIRQWHASELVHGKKI